MSAVHRNKIDVAIDEQVALDSTFIYSQRFVMPRVSESDKFVIVLGIVVVIAVGIKLVEYLGSDHPLHLPLGHLSMKRICDDQMNIVDTVGGAHVQYNLKQGLTHV